MNEQQLGELFDKVIARVVAFNQQKHSKVFTIRFSNIEQAQLKQILEEWIEIEKSRLPFKVFITEQTQQNAFEGLEINIRVGRVDLLEDDRQVIIDYKSGWQGQRNVLGSVQVIHNCRFILLLRSQK